MRYAALLPLKRAPYASTSFWPFHISYLEGAQSKLHACPLSCRKTLGKKLGQKSHAKHQFRASVRVTLLALVFIDCISFLHSHYIMQKLQIHLHGLHGLIGLWVQHLTFAPLHISQAPQPITISNNDNPTHKLCYISMTARFLHVHYVLNM